MLSIMNYSMERMINMYTVRLKDGTQFTCKYYEQVSGVYYFYQTSLGVTFTSLASEIDYIY